MDQFCFFSRLNTARHVDNFFREIIYQSEIIHLSFSKLAYFWLQFSTFLLDFCKGCANKKRYRVLQGWFLHEISAIMIQNDFSFSFFRCCCCCHSVTKVWLQNIDWFFIFKKVCVVSRYSVYFYLLFTPKI